MTQIGLLIDGESQYPLSVGDNESFEFSLMMDAEEQFALIWDSDVYSNIMLDRGEQILGLATDDIFGWKMIALVPSALAAEMQSAPMKIVFSTILKPNGNLAAYIDHTRAPLYLRHNFSGVNQAIGIAESTLTQTQALSGSELSAEVTTNSASLTQAILTFISDWSDYYMDDLKELTIDQMIYKEVGA